MRERDRPYLDVLESLAAQEAGKLLLVGESEDGRPDRDVRGRRHCGCGQRVDEHAEDPRTLG